MKRGQNATHGWAMTDLHIYIYIHTHTQCCCYLWLLSDISYRYVYVYIYILPYRPTPWKNGLIFVLCVKTKLKNTTKPSIFTIVRIPRNPVVDCVGSCSWKRTESKLPSSEDLESLGKQRRRRRRRRRRRKEEEEEEEEKRRRRKTKMLE